MKKIQLGLVVFLLGLGFSSSILAHDSIGFSVNIGQPYYYVPAPIAYQPPPVAYYQGGPAYYQAAPGPYYNYQNAYCDDDWRACRRHHRHHERDDD